MRVEESQAPGRKLAWVIAIALLLSIPLFSVWLLVYDRQSQSQEASDSITAGWGSRQVIVAPLIAAPYQPLPALAANGQPIPQQRQELVIAPERLAVSTQLAPEVRRKSIYEAVVYTARISGRATFNLPGDMTRGGIDPGRAALGQSELRFGVSDARGIGANPRIAVNGHALRLQPGGGSSPGTGFFAWLDAAALTSGPLVVDFSYDLRGSDGLSLVPRAGATSWTVDSSWPSPSFEGGFLPAKRTVSDSGFSAAYNIGNLATGRALTELRDPTVNDRASANAVEAGRSPSDGAGIALIRPVDLYSRVDRSAKYGFLFIGFTFLTLLMFDVIGGAHVSAVEYLLTGAALVLFFVLLLAFAEVIGFLFAYLVAAGAITGLITAYSAAVLKSWKRAQFMALLLAGLYALLYVLLGLEAYSLLIGSVLSFIALAGVMYTTRNVDWGDKAGRATAA